LSNTNHAISDTSQAMGDTSHAIGDTSHAIGDTNWTELGIRFSMIPSERYEDVVKFCYANFFPDEPISRSLGICQPGGPRNFLMDKYYIKDALKDGVSMMATDASDNIVAVRIGKVVRRTQIHSLSLSDVILKVASWLLPVLPKEYGQFFFLLELFNRMNYDVAAAFDLLNCDVIYEDSLLASARHSRVKGLGTELVRRSLDIARAAGCQHIYTIATGDYSSKIFFKLDFTLDNEHFYDQLKDEEGRQILQDTREHSRSRIFHKKL